MFIRSPIPSAPRAAIEPEPSPSDAPVVPQSDPTVMVNKKPVNTSATKVGEQKLTGQVQEAKVRSLFAETQKEQTVRLNPQSPVRKDECRDKNSTE
jgi:hypothetical protein